jgi:TRAP-type transport system periplasmic protein
MKTWIRATVLSAVAALATLGAATVQAQEVTLKVHFFLPATSYANTLFITPWCDKIAKDSNQRVDAAWLHGRPVPYRGSL